MGEITRPAKAGENLGKAICDMVHLMYQNDTAIYFLEALIEILEIDWKDRSFRRIKKIKKGELKDGKDQG